MYNVIVNSCRNNDPPYQIMHENDAFNLEIVHWPHNEIIRETLCLIKFINGLVSGSKNGHGHGHGQWLTS